MSEANQQVVQDLAGYPEFLQFVDPGAAGVTVEPRGEDRFLLTMRGEDGGQVLLTRQGGEVKLVAADNELPSAGRTSADSTSLEFVLASARFVTGQPCTPEEHEKVARTMVAAVGHFSSAEGPDGGNLACMWAVRHIVHQALGFWITRANGTAVFYPELQACVGDARDEGDILPGGIVISPTQNTNIGHVGLLGDGRGDARLIYSNSSARAVWTQSHTIGSWRAHYQGRKGLPVLFFPLPHPGV